VPAGRVVMLEGLGRMVRVDDDEEAWQRRMAFDYLWNAAEPPARALKQAAENLEG
jgi:hypothetical protein